MRRWQEYTGNEALLEGSGQRFSAVVAERIGDEEQEARASAEAPEHAEA